MLHAPNWRHIGADDVTEIRFEAVGKRYGTDIAVISDLNLTVTDGEFMVLVGPSGCAKSTTLRMIAGLEDITEGTLWIGGQAANHLAPRERDISMVFQSYALFPNMTVRGNLAFGMQIRKEPRERIAAEVERVADMLGLTPLLDRRPRELSGGQAQRVALGRAMIRQPGAFLFDEPLSNLDAELRVNMRAEISRMQRALGVTTVYVTHDQTEAMTMGDRVAVMNKGQIMQVGAPLDLYRTPANLFVAGFIGSPRMNLMTLRENPEIAAGLAPTIAGHSDALTVGFRPEHVVIGDAGDDALGLSGRVDWVEALGHETLVKVHVGEPDLSVVVRTSGETVSNIAIGEQVGLAVPHRHLLAFDSDSGRRVT